MYDPSCTEDCNVKRTWCVADTGGGHDTCGVLLIVFFFTHFYEGKECICSVSWRGIYTYTHIHTERERKRGMDFCCCEGNVADFMLLPERLRYLHLSLSLLSLSCSCYSTCRDVLLQLHLMVPYFHGVPPLHTHTYTRSGALWDIDTCVHT